MYYRPFAAFFSECIQSLPFVCAEVQLSCICYSSMTHGLFGRTSVRRWLWGHSCPKVSGHLWQKSPKVSGWQEQQLFFDGHCKNKYILVIFISKVCCSEYSSENILHMHLKISLYDFLMLLSFDPLIFELIFSYFCQANRVPARWRRKCA